MNGAQDKPTNMTDFIHPHDTDMDKENKSLQIIPLTAGTRKHNIPWGILFQCSKNDQETMTDNEHVSVPYINQNAKETLPNQYMLLRPNNNQKLEQPITAKLKTQ